MRYTAVVNHASNTLPGRPSINITFLAYGDQDVSVNEGATHRRSYFVDDEELMGADLVNWVKYGRPPAPQS